VSEEFVLTLEWICQTCGWSFVVDAPGFAGDGRFHYPSGGLNACGPIFARRVSPRERVAREDRAAEVRLRGEERVAELEKEANR